MTHASQIALTSSTMRSFDGAAGAGAKSLQPYWVTQPSFIIMVETASAWSSLSTKPKGSATA